MKKETVIRQNRCDREMSLILFGSFFLFMVMQLPGIGAQNQLLTDRISRLFCMVSAAGFAFLLGYCFERRTKNPPLQKRGALSGGNGGCSCQVGIEKPHLTSCEAACVHEEVAIGDSECLLYRCARLYTEEKAKTWTLKAAVFCWLVFLFLAGGQAVLMQRMSVKKSVADIITAVMVPSMSVPFFSLAVMLLLIWIFFGTVRRLSAHRKAAILAGILVLCCSFLRTQQESYAFVAAMFGQSGIVSVPAVPYFAYFLLGIWFEKKKPGFQWKIAAVMAGVTVVSVLLYGTGLQNLCLVTISALPVYLIYAFSEEVLTEITLRVRFIECGCNLTELVFLIYALMLFVLGRKNILAEASVWKTLIVAAGMILLIYAALIGFWAFSLGYEALRARFLKVKHKRVVYFLLYTAVFSVVLFLVFFEFWRTGKTFIIKGDGIAQYYPRILYFSRYIREFFANLLNGNFSLPMYDFRIGMGAEVTYSLEPLYFLFALFNEEHMEFAYALVTVLRFYLSGVTMSVLCLYFKKGYFASFLASVVYVISGFALYGGTMHTMFMIPMIMLPLLIIAIEEILRGRRWYLCTIFTAISLFSNYYYLYMNTIAMGIYFLVRFFCRKKQEDRTIKKFMGRTLVISGSYLLGIAMSCIVLVTTFGMYLGSDRGGGALIKTPSLFYYSKEWLVSCFLTFLTTANSPGEWLKLGYLPIALLAVVILFMRKGRKELKIMSVLAMIFMAFPLFGFIFSGFSAVINRWCYMAALLVAYIAAECFSDMRNMSVKEVAGCTGITLAYAYLAYFGLYKSTRYTKHAAVLLIATLVVLLVCQMGQRWMREAMKKCMILVLTAAIVFYQGYSLFHMDGRINGYAEPGETMTEVTDTPLRALEKLEDESFYRASELKPQYNSYNAPYVLDFNGTTLLSSTLNGYMTDYLGKMGCTSYTMIRMNGLNNRTYLNSLASVKYLAYFGEPSSPLPYGYEMVLETEIDGTSTTVCENKYVLPLGYTYTDTISIEDLESRPVAERQEVLMQKVLLNMAADENTVTEQTVETDEEKGNTDSEKSVAEPNEAEETEGFTVTASPIEIIDKEENGIELQEHAMTATKEEEDEACSVTLQFESLPNSEVYLVLNQAFLEGDMSEEAIKIVVTTEGNRVSYDFRPDDYRYGSGQDDYVINLGYYEEPITSCTITMNREGMIQFESLELYSQPMDNLKEYTDELTQDVLEQVEIETNRVSGVISLEEDKILTLSIPYQKGWKAYVDGEETKLYQANYMYMAIPLEAGDHEIELTFEIPGVNAALKIMLSSVILFLVLCAVGGIVRRKKQNG